MAGSGDNEATFDVNLEDHVSGSAKKAADSMESLRDRILGGQDAIKSMVADMRRLRGSSDAVKSAKDALKAKIGAERDAISAATLQIRKHGTSLEEVGRKQKESKERFEKMSSVMRLFRLPLSDIKGRFAALGETGMSAGALAARGLALIATATIATVAALAAVALGVVGVVAAFGKFVIGSANAARTAGLTREAFTGSADDAARLGNQVDALARKVPTAKGELNELAASLRKNRLGGDLLVDSFNAIGQASAGLGEDAGAKVREIIERGRLSGRLQINPQELLGTGIDFTGIAKALGSEMHIGVKEATAALFEGRATLGDGAKAIREGIEKQVAGINLRKMLDVNVIADKLHESFQALTKGVKLEPFLEGLEKITSRFDASTTSGKALQGIVSRFGQGMVDALTAGLPIVDNFIRFLVLNGLKLELAYLKVRIALKNSFGDPKFLSDADALKFASQAAEIAATAFALAIVTAGAVVAALGAATLVAAKKVVSLYDAMKNLFAGLKTGDWKKSGLAIGDGLVAGLTGAQGAVSTAVGALGDTASDKFTGDMEIHSPSKKFQRYGKALPDGVVGGVEDGTPAVQAAVSGMVAAPGEGGAGGGGGGGAKVEVNFIVQISGGNQDAAKQIRDSGILAQVTKVIEDACRSAGIPTQAAA